MFKLNPAQKALAALLFVLFLFVFNQISYREGYRDATNATNNAQTVKVINQTKELQDISDKHEAGAIVAEAILAPAKVKQEEKVKAYVPSIHQKPKESHHGKDQAVRPTVSVDAEWVRLHNEFATDCDVTGPSCTPQAGVPGVAVAHP